MTTILADFYREALKSLEKQLSAGNVDPIGQRKLMPNGREASVSASLPVLCPLMQTHLTCLLASGPAASLT